MVKEATEKDGKANIDYLQAVYEIKVEEWRINLRRLRQAKYLLANWLDLSIRDEVSDMTPHEASVDLRETYKMDNERALKIAETKLAGLTFNASEPVMTFVSKVRTLQRDIQDAEGVCTRARVMDKISRSLPKDQFANSIKDISIIINNMPDATEMSLSEYIGRLSAEFDLPKVGGATKGDRKKDKDKKKRDKCAVWRKWSHTADKCWHAHPELRPNTHEATITEKKSRDNTNNKPENKGKAKESNHTTTLNDLDLDLDLDTLIRLFHDCKAKKVEMHKMYS
jgi:hypothetical protein